MSSSIGQPFALNPHQGHIAALCIGDLPIIIPEIKLPYIPFEVLGADMLINTYKAPLQDAEIVLNRVRVDRPF